MTTTAPTITEAAFQAQVIELAHLFGWRVAHFRPALTKHGWRTPVSADGKGFPDLVLVRRKRLIFAELKSQRGRLSPEQRDWWEALTHVAEAYVWRPSDWPAIEAELR